MANLLTGKTRPPPYPAALPRWNCLEYLAEIAEVQVVIEQVRLLFDSCYIELFGKRINDLLTGALLATIKTSVPPSQNRKTDNQNADKAE